MNDLINIFLIVAKTGSFRKAAEKLYLSAPSVMQKINELEKQTELTLFTRSNHGSQLTTSGKYFYQKMLILEKEYQNAITEAKKLDNQSLEIKVAYSPLTPNNYLIDHMSAIMKSEPKFKFKYIPFVNTTEGFFSTLKNIGKRTDIMVVSIDNKTLQNYDCKFLYLEDTPVLLGGKFSKTVKEINLSSLKGKTINIPDHVNTKAYSQVEDYLKKNYPTIKIKHIISQSLSDINYAINHDQFILANKDLANTVPQFNLAKVNWSFTTPYGIVYGKHCSRAVDRLLNIIKDMPDF